MPLKFFAVPAIAPAEAENELSGFMARHRVVTIDRRLVSHEGTAWWAICIEYVAGPTSNTRPVAFGRSRIDYKQVLTPPEFAVFSRLRELRKSIAQEEAVPVYAVFTNEQLAQVVQNRCRTVADLRRIDGVGEARIEKYAERLLTITVELPEVADEATGKPLSDDP